MLTIPCQLQQLQGLSCFLAADTAQSCLSGHGWLLSALPRIYAVDLQSQKGADAHYTHAATGHNKCGQQSHRNAVAEHVQETSDVGWTHTYEVLLNGLWPCRASDELWCIQCGHQAEQGLHGVATLYDSHLHNLLHSLQYISNNDMSRGDYSAFSTLTKTAVPDIPDCP